MRKEALTIDEKNIEIYISDVEDAPTVYSCDFSNNAEEVLAACDEIDCPEFHLVSISGIHWDEEMSPWAHEPVVSKDDNFTGEADAFLNILETGIIPRVHEYLPNSGVAVLNGYSMGGLFTLYAAHKSSSFSAYAAPSGSVWFPDFLDYVRDNGFTKEPKAIYLSIGDRESRTRNSYLSQTESIMKELSEIYLARNISVTFELNKGNHFKGVNNRIAKGLKWVLTAIAE